MKKKYLSYLLLMIVAGFWSCKSEDSVFEQTADERINESLAAYQKELAEAPYGWKGIIYPGTGGVFSFYFKFNEQNRVVMYSDFAAESAVTPKESSYRLKSIETPSLIFDTYSYLHVLADPDGNINGGVTGDGLKSDFEFSFAKDTLDDGVINLTGVKNQSRLILTKATQEESVAYAGGGVGKSLLFNNIAKYLTYFKRITIGAVQYEVTFNTTGRTIKLNWLDGTTLKTFTTEYYYGPSGIVFITPLVNGSQTITGFTDLTWNATNLSVGLTAAGVKTTVVAAAKPLQPDVAAAKSWYQTPIAQDGYWVSLNGFHVNGVDDAFKVNSLTSGTATYYFYLYWPQYGSNYDAFAPIFLQNNSLSLLYADAPKAPTFTTDGRVIFTASSILGDAYPKTGPAVDSKNYLYDANGFYLVKLSETAYDMVSAKDGKGWIRWER